MKNNLERLHNIKDAIRAKYAWPGGYPLFLVMSDGEALSIDAARDNWRQICRALLDDHQTGWPDKQWLPIAADVNWENDDLYCCHTGEKIESAYGDD